MLATMMLSGLGIATALNVPFQNFSKSCFSPWSTPAMASQCSGGEYREELGRFCAVVSMNPHTVGLCVGGCTRELSKFWNQRIVWGNAAPFLIFLFFLKRFNFFWESVFTFSPSLPWRRYGDRYSGQLLFIGSASPLALHSSQRSRFPPSNQFESLSSRPKSFSAQYPLNSWQLVRKVQCQRISVRVCGRKSCDNLSWWWLVRVAMWRTQLMVARFCCAHLVTLKKRRLGGFGSLGAWPSLPARSLSRSRSLTWTKDCACCLNQHNKRLWGRRRGSRRSMCQAQYFRGKAFPPYISPGGLTVNHPPPSYNNHLSLKPHLHLQSAQVIAVQTKATTLLIKCLCIYVHSSCHSFNLKDTESNVWTDQILFWNNCQVINAITNINVVIMY